MKLFTVKDFIAYNNPCFSCGEKIIFTFGEAINPIIDGKVCTVQLVTFYSSSLSLTINLKTNKFQASDMNSFKEYVGQKSIKLESWCSNCHTRIKTNKLSFNFNKCYVEPCSIEIEHLRVRRGIFLYTITTASDGSLFQIQKNGSIILDIGAGEKPTTLAKIKTREKLISKLKTYMTFS